MAIKENQLTDLQDIGLTDKVRLVTSGGVSNNGLLSTLADAIFTKYKRYFININESAYSAIGRLSDNATMGQEYGTCQTAAATAAKTVSISDYRRTSGGIVTIRFQYAVPANATLNISDTGAYPIHYKNTSITAGVINAGDTCTFMFDGSNYVLIAMEPQGSIITGSTITTTVPTATKTNCAKLTLPPGAWIITYQVGLNVGTSQHTYQATITTDSDIASQQIYSLGVLRHNLAAILNTTSNTNVYGTVYHNIGSDGTALQNRLTAVRIA